MHTTLYNDSSLVGLRYPWVFAFHAWRVVESALPVTVAVIERRADSTTVAIEVICAVVIRQHAQVWAHIGEEWQNKVHFVLKVRSLGVWVPGLALKTDQRSGADQVFGLVVPAEVREPGEACYLLSVLPTCARPWRWRNPQMSSEAAAILERKRGQGWLHCTDVFEEGWVGV